MQNSKLKIIGISGPSCAGKSTLAKTLTQELNSIYNPICIDNPYFYQNRIPMFKDELNNIITPNYECKEAYNFEKMTKAIQTLRLDIANCSDILNASTEYRFAKIRSDYDNSSSNKQNTLYAIVEGFLLFADDAVANECDIRIFIRGDQQECQMRREYREGFPKILYDCMVWPAYLKYEAEQISRSHHVLHGSSDRNTILEQALNIIHKS
jgi:uridine kinase